MTGIVRAAAVRETDSARPAEAARDELERAVAAAEKLLLDVGGGPRWKLLIRWLLTPEFRMVLRWPGLRGEDKLSWLLNNIETRGGSREIVTTAAHIGDQQGTSDDAGRRRLAKLTTAGLLTARDEGNGRFALRLNEPQEAAKARGIMWDPQPTLFPMEGDEVSSEGSCAGPGEFPSASTIPRALADAPVEAASGVGQRLAAEPRTAEPRTAEPRQPVFLLSSPREKQTSLSSVLSLRNEERQNTEDARRGSAGRGSAVGTDLGPEPAPLATSLGELLSRPLATEASDEQRVKQLVAEWRRRVNDRDLRDSPCVTAAWAILQGKLPQREISHILAKLDTTRNAGMLTCPASAYFNIQLQWALFRHGLGPMPEKKNREEP